MTSLDWIVLALFFLLMVGIGIWSARHIHSCDDFFACGGKMPWWLSGISHHMSGYSAAVFVAYAAVAYQYGFTIYVWWAVPIAIACFIGAIYFAPRWARLRERMNIVSPMEYLAIRYDLPTQQLMAWSGVVLKIFDVGAKWASIAIVLNVFTGIPIHIGIIVSGVVSMVYVTIGGLWADALTDMAQFIVQLVAGLAMFFIILGKLGGVSAITGLWLQLPPSHAQLFNGSFTEGFAITYLFICLLSYNGGTWNLAQRYIASPTGSDARKAAFLSSALYLIWPLILFFPMWAAPIFFPNLPDPSQSYSKMAMELLPPGLIGLVLASMFAHTMAMATSDANAITAVITRDIIPVVYKKSTQWSKKKGLMVARMTTFLFMVSTWIIALNADSFGGILSLLIVWFGAMVGPISIAMLLGLLPAFKHSNSAIAISSLVAGLITFGVVKYGIASKEVVYTMACPLLVSAVIYIVGGWLNRNKPVKPEVESLIESLNYDSPKTEEKASSPVQG